MRTKLPALLLLVVLIPLGITGWLGMRMAAEEQQQTRLRFEQLLQQRLQEIARPLESMVEERKLALLADTAGFGALSTPELQTLGWKHPEVEQFFLLGTDERLRFPDPDTALSRREAAFVERTRAIWAEQALFRQPGPETEVAPSPKLASSLDSFSRSPAPPAPEPTNHGWFSWHWGNGLNLLFWQQLPDGSIAGAELDRLTLLSDLIALLPDNSGNGDSRIRLLDARERILYQWGGFEPRPNSAPLAELPLQPPLDSWRLAYFGPADTVPSGEAARFQIVLGLAIVILLALLILTYIYRELTRAMREAGQRVNFVNQVSHELKTPLTNIRMYAELLQQDLEEDEASHGRLKVIVDETQRLSRLIGNVLGFARGQRKALTLRPVSAVLDRCVEEVLNPFLPNLEQQGIRVETRLNAPEPFPFDPDAVTQIIANLLNNVEKYAAEGSYLLVTTRQEGDSFLLEVCDHGPGIAPSLRQRIFKPFFRVRSDLTEGVSGTGIGLSISRDLARLHGGDLTLEPSERGACFRLRLPGVQA